MAHSKDELKNFLRQGVLEVLFKKVKTGEERLMKCTLKEELLPHVDLTENISSVKENTNIVRVFDIDKKEWRSFRLDTIISVKLL